MNSARAGVLAWLDARAIHLHYIDEDITMMGGLTGVWHGRLEVSIIIFKIPNRSYPIQRVLDTVPGVS